MRDPGNDPIVILSEEGVTQGDPLAIVIYGIMLLPLAEILREAYLNVLQPRSGGPCIATSSAYQGWRTSG